MPPGFRVHTDDQECIVVRLALPVADFKTKEPKIDRATNNQVYELRVVSLGDDDAEMFKVKFSSPKFPEFEKGTRVRLEGLTVRPYQMGDRSGVSFFCDRVVPVSAGSGKSATA